CRVRLLLLPILPDRFPVPRRPPRLRRRMIFSWRRTVVFSGRKELGLGVGVVACVSVRRRVGAGGVAGVGVGTCPGVVLQQLVDI
ncbi:hypothetical protein U1Q18_022690, partial [Sarracenia purpurea var. burkii]